MQKSNTNQLKQLGIGRGIHSAQRPFTMPLTSRVGTALESLSNIQLPASQNFLLTNRPSETQLYMMNNNMRLPPSSFHTRQPPSLYAERIGGISGQGIGPNNAGGEFTAFGGDIVKDQREYSTHKKRQRPDDDAPILSGPLIYTETPIPSVSDNTAAADSSTTDQSTSSSTPQQSSAVLPILVPVIQKIDSLQRNKLSYPNDNSYVMNFPSIDNVVRARIIESTISNSQYTINTYCNTIYFTEKTGATPTTYTATMVNGNYDTTTLPVEVARAMNAAFAGTFTCTFNDTTEKLTIARGDGLGTFIFTWLTNASSNNSAQEPMGFDYVDSTAYATSQTSDNIVNLGGPNYLDIDIDEFSTIGPSSKQFAGIQLDQAPGYTSFNTFTSNVRCFRTPQRFSKVTVKFYNPVSAVSGRRNLFLFNGIPNNFSIEFLTLQN